MVDTDKQIILSRILDIILTEDTLKRPVIYYECSSNTNETSLEYNIKDGYCLPNLDNIDKNSEFNEFFLNYKNYKSPFTTVGFYIHDNNYDFNEIYFNINKNKVKYTDIYKNINIIKNNIIQIFKVNNCLNSWFYAAIWFHIENQLKIHFENKNMPLSIHNRDIIVAIHYNNNNNKNKICDKNNKFIEEIQNQNISGDYKIYINPDNDNNYNINKNIILSLPSVII